MRIGNYGEFQEALRLPLRVARWQDARTGVELYIRGYTLAERLEWKDSRWSCEKDQEGKVAIFREELFALSVVVRLASLDQAGEQPLYGLEQISPGMFQCQHANERQGLPPGVVSRLFLASNEAAGLNMEPELVLPEEAALEDPLARLRRAYCSTSWVRNILPLLPEAELCLKAPTLSDYMGVWDAVRPVDGSTDRDFGLPRLLSACLLDSEGAPLIPANDWKWVEERLPYGSALALSEACGRVAGFGAGALDFFPGPVTGPKETIGPES